MYICDYKYCMIAALNLIEEKESQAKNAAALQIHFMKSNSCDRAK